METNAPYDAEPNTTAGIREREEILRQSCPDPFDGLDQPLVNRAEEFLASTAAAEAKRPVQICASNGMLYALMANGKIRWAVPGSTWTDLPEQPGDTVE